MVQVQSLGLSTVDLIKLIAFTHIFGMAVYEKVYVAMILRVDSDGNMKPVEIEWENGEHFLITKIVDVRQAPPRHVGSSQTIRYTVDLAGNRRELYHEGNRWFVEKLVSLD